MKLLLLISALFVAAAVVVAVPVETGDDVDNLGDDFSDKPQLVDEKSTVDVTDLINDMRRLHERASDVMQQVEATLSTLESLMPHSIRKRETSIGGSISRGPGGATGRVDINHTHGDTTYNGNISHGPEGTSYGVGVTHRTGNTNLGANISHGTDGTSYDVNIGQTWNDGRTSLDASIGQEAGGGPSAQITFTHRF